jgi:hypothetical protein
VIEEKVMKHKILEALGVIILGVLLAAMFVYGGF